jgi:protein gp37
MNHRFHREGPVTFRADRLELPLHVKKPTIWAIWSDLFHEEITAYQITSVFEVMQSCPQHTFIICTKRPERISPVLYGDEGLWYLGGGDYLPNVILMTTAEDQENADKRICEIFNCWPFHMAVSIEPILGPVDLIEFLIPQLCGGRKLGWVIVGCETGPKRRPCNLEWIRSIRDQCKAAGVPLWVKGIEAPRMCGAYIGGTFLQHTNAIGPVHVSHNTAEWPEDLRIRQMPFTGGPK